MKDCEKAKQLPPKMYLGIGTDETADEEPNAEIVKSVEELEKVLRKKGMGPTRLKVVVEEEAQPTMRQRGRAGCRKHCCFCTGSSNWQL